MQTQLTLNLGIDEKVDVRSLIVHGDIEQEAPKAKREQPTPEFERVLTDGADCAFRRRCGSRSQMLVLLVTQGQYYVTDERTGSRHALTTARLGTFCFRQDRSFMGGTQNFQAWHCEFSCSARHAA